MRRRTILLGVAGALALAPTAADADVLVAYDHVVSGQGFNIAVKNLQQDGANVTLPAGVNTTANELHPTLSGDGQFLVFQRDTLANTPGPERPPVYNKQIVVVDMHAGRVVTPAAFQFSDQLRTTPAISADARWIVNGNSPFLDSQQAFATITDRASSATARLNDIVPAPPPPPATPCPSSELCIAPGALPSSTEITIAPDAVPVTPGSARTSILNPSVGTGATPLIAWSNSRVVRYSDGTTGANIGLRVRRYGGGFAARPTVDVTVSRATNEVFGHPAVVADALVAFERLPVSAGGGVGNGDIWAADTAGRINRSLPQINTAADERQPAWTRDGRYLAVLRRAADGSERVLLFDFANNLLVNPAGLPVPKPPTDSRPLGESRPLQGSISIADDPTARTETINLIAPRMECTSATKGGTPQPTNCRSSGQR